MSNPIDLSAKVARAATLRTLSKRQLGALYRRLGYIGGAHPVETWHKDEIIDAIIEAEAERDAAAKRRAAGEVTP